mmetsp:Transcript_26405/g.70138  ORF Transcript_26405/g.70138 Transcript_26405/m.70138 type:complete len:205 (-) Transcript_26405:145-759(-)
MNSEPSWAPMANPSDSRNASNFSCSPGASVQRFHAEAASVSFCSTFCTANTSRRCASQRCSPGSAKRCWAALSADADDVPPVAAPSGPGGSCQKESKKLRVSLCLASPLLRAAELPLVSLSTTSSSSSSSSSLTASSGASMSTSSASASASSAGPASSSSTPAPFMIGAFWSSTSPSVAPPSSSPTSSPASSSSSSSSSCSLSS